LRRLDEVGDCDAQFVTGKIASVAVILALFCVIADAEADAAIW
jgi:hypothetical protein